MVHHPMKKHYTRKLKRSAPHIKKRNYRPARRHRKTRLVTLLLKNNLTTNRNPETLALTYSLYVRTLGKEHLQKHTFQIYEKNIMQSAVGL
jgi:hypothetical protein